MSEQPRGRFPRRAFLAGTGATVLAGVMYGASPEALIRWLSDSRSSGGPDGQVAEHDHLLPFERIESSSFGDGADFTFAVERAEDLVLLDFAFYGFAFGTVASGSGDGLIGELYPTTDSNVIVVRFPPQAIGEANYNVQADGMWPVDPPPVLSIVSAPSRLCFQVPSGDVVTLPTMTAADLLDWSSWTLLVPEAAQVAGPPLIIEGPRTIKSPSSETHHVRHANGVDGLTPTPATSQQTSIEYPTNVFLAPTVYTSGSPFYGFTTTFATVQQPVTSPNGLSDLWTATLQQSPTLFRPPGPAEVVAFYANDFNSGFEDVSAIDQIEY